MCTGLWLAGCGDCTWALQAAWDKGYAMQGATKAQPKPFIQRRLLTIYHGLEGGYVSWWVVVILRCLGEVASS